MQMPPSTAGAAGAAESWWWSCPVPPQPEESATKSNGRFNIASEEDDAYEQRERNFLDLEATHATGAARQGACRCADVKGGLRQECGRLQ